MKTKLLSMAMAAIMAVTCLAGCSAGSAGDPMVDAAKKYGMKELGEIKEITNLSIPTEDGSGYYVSKDEKEADYMTLAFGGKDPGAADDIKTEKFVMCIDSNLLSREPGSATTTITQASLKDEDSAKKLYEAVASNINDRFSEVTKGEENGVTYSITYDGDESTLRFSGVYLKGNTVYRINCTGLGDHDGKCTESFCKELGLVSPLTLK